MNVQNQSAELLQECLQRMGRIVTEMNTPEQFPLHIIAECRRFIGCEAASLALYDTDREDLVFCASSGGESERLLEWRLPMGLGVVGYVAQTRQGLIVNDVQSDPRWFSQIDQQSTFQTRQLMATPIQYAGKMLGVIEVLNRIDDAPFEATELDRLQIFADHLAPILEAQRMVQLRLQSERLSCLALVITDLGHSIKNIIQRLESPIMMMNTGIEKGDLTMISQLWPIMRRATENLGGLARQMLDFARTRELNPAWHDLSQLMTDVIEECHGTASAHGISLTFTCEAAQNRAWVDGDVLRQSLHNLVGNSLEAIEEFGGSSIALTLGRDPQGGAFLITVADDGPGIPAEIQSRIFEPFFSTKAKKGTGLGLAGVRKAAEDHGGRIELTSAPGKGTRFVLILPCGAATQ